MPFLVLIVFTIISFSFKLITKKYLYDNRKALKVIAILLFLVYMFRLFSIDLIDKTFKLTQILVHQTTIEGVVEDHFIEPLFSPVFTSFLMILRWFTVVVLAVSIIAPFMDSKTYRNICAFIGVPVCLLNTILFIPNLIGFVGRDYNIFGYRSIEFFFEIVFMMLICSSFLIKKIKTKDFVDIKKQIKLMVFIFICLLPAFFEISLLQVFFGRLGESTDDFSVIHRITMYIAFGTMALLYFSLRNRPLKDRKLFFVTVALAGFFQYFYNKTYNMGITGLPLHLCNTAIIMMFFSFIFKLDGVFYFSYFVNVLGAFCAIVLPGIGTDAFSMDSISFWYNHIYAFILPILGVALKVWSRPKMKMMLKAMGIFTIYFICVAFLNALFNGILIKNGSTDRVDYFFLYGHFYTDKFSFVSEFKALNTFSFDINGINLIFFWKYQLLIYVVFIGLMFIIWYVYDLFFKVSDSHYALRERLKKQRMDMVKLENDKALYKERAIIMNDLNDQVMVNISHFTKSYGNTGKKSVDDLSIEINKGEVCGFLGHNGAGKSTTIKSLVGIQSITSGKIEICGYDIASQPLEAKLNIGYVSDNHVVYEKLTGREYINYVADLYMVSKEDRDARLEKYLKMFELEDAIDREIKSYSHGMKQKIVVISSLIHDPKVWVLDEPLTGLDPSSAFQIKECMREHANKGNAVFFSSHVIEIVEKICDKIVIIGKGKRKGVFYIKDLIENNISLEQLYLRHVYKSADTNELSLEELVKEFKK